MDLCFRKVWKSLKSLVDVSNCTFGNDPNEIELTHAPSNPNACPPHEFDIIGEHDDNMNKFINSCINNLEANEKFYTSMIQSTPIIPPLDMSGYLHA
jgi:hypothetical protein